MEREEKLCFFSMYQVPGDLVHQNTKRYLFLSGKGLFLCFWAQKKRRVDTLLVFVRKVFVLATTLIFCEKRFLAVLVRLVIFGGLGSTCKHVRANGEIVEACSME